MFTPSQGTPPAPREAKCGHPARAPLHRANEPEARRPQSQRPPAATQNPLPTPSNQKGLAPPPPPGRAAAAHCRARREQPQPDPRAQAGAPQPVTGAQDNTRHPRACHHHERGNTGPLGLSPGWDREPGRNPHAWHQLEPETRRDRIRGRASYSSSRWGPGGGGTRAALQAWHRGEETRGPPLRDTEASLGSVTGIEGDTGAFAGAEGTQTWQQRQGPQGLPPRPVTTGRGHRGLPLACHRS